jgi:hypothetical protein
MQDSSYIPKQEHDLYEPIRLGDWLLTILITVIPVLNIIMLAIWAFSYKTHPSKKTWAQANLIIIGISIGFAILAFGSLITGLMALFTAMNGVEMG